MRHVGWAKSQVENDWSWDHFRVSPSCPPDRKIWMRGGLLYWSPSGFGATYSYKGWWLNSTQIDLADITKIDVDVTFVNANYFLGYAVLLAVPSDPDNLTFILNGTGVEYSTAVDCENALVDALFTETPWYYGYPLCAVVLKNDGIVGSGCNILPIDYVNRGRSYMFRPDIRPLEHEGA